MPGSPRFLHQQSLQCGCHLVLSAVMRFASKAPLSAKPAATDNKRWLPMFTVTVNANDTSACMGRICLCTRATTLCTAAAAASASRQVLWQLRLEVSRTRVQGKCRRYHLRFQVSTWNGGLAYELQLLHGDTFTAYHRTDHILATAACGFRREWRMAMHLPPHWPRLRTRC